METQSSVQTIQETRPVVTIPERWTTEVTHSDILDGIACAANLCPLVRSITRTLHQMGVQFAYVSVLRDDVEIILDHDQPALKFWHDANSFVDSIDRGRHVEPRTVSLVRVP